MKLTAIVFLTFVTSTVFGLFNNDNAIKIKIEQKCPEWIVRSVDKSLKPFVFRPISKSYLNDLFNLYSKDYYIVRFKIENNTVSVDYLFEFDVDNRVFTYENALKKLCRIVPMPDVTFFLCIHDGLYPWIYEKVEGKLPIFAMSQKVGMEGILIPDYMALGEKFQVLDNVDITALKREWRLKKECLVWRGSTEQHSYDNKTNYVQSGNIDQYSRIKLCNLSFQYPKIINAKFTKFAQGSDLLPELQKFRGNWLSYEKQILYKYQIVIDGNVSSYANSGWRFFTNSVVFKPESAWTQWYFDELIPDIHYISVQENLDNLVEKVMWAKTHDAIAESIAQNAVIFAKEHLTISAHMTYMYYLLKSYSELNFYD